jgi:peroxiredoxin
LGRLNADFLSAGSQVLVILGDTLERARSYRDALHLPFPVLSDPPRAVYHQYGLEKALRVIQRTASIVIDRAGTIRYLVRSTDPTRWLSESRKVLTAARSLPGG